MRKVTEIQIDMGRTARKIETQRKLIDAAQTRLADLESEAAAFAKEYNEATAAVAVAYLSKVKSGGEKSE